MDFAALSISLILIIVTVAVSLLAFAMPEVWRFLALEPAKMIQTRQYHQVITSGLVHGGLAHLFVNMLTLYFFGPGLERRIIAATGSAAPFMAIYLASLVIGSLYPLVKYRNRPDYVAVGASGAISGIVFAYCLAAPTTTFYVFFALPMPAWLFGILYVAYSTYAMRNVEDNIGHEAHLAGALGGVIATIVFAPEIVELFHLIGIPFP